MIATAPTKPAATGKTTPKAAEYRAWQYVGGATEPITCTWPDGMEYDAWLKREGFWNHAALEIGDRDTGLAVTVYEARDVKSWYSYLVAVTIGDDVQHVFVLSPVDLLAFLGIARLAIKAAA